MAVTQHHDALLRVLKKQIRVLHKKEEQNRAKLQSALTKMRELGNNYKHKLVSKMRRMRHKITKSEASMYVEVAADIERQFLKGIENKLKSLRLVLDRLEKQQPSKLTERIIKKG